MTIDSENTRFYRDNYGDLCFQENKNGSWYFSEVLENILIEKYGFCGCACPNDATEFLIGQLVELKKGKDLFSLKGGLEFFKFCCYQLGLINENGGFSSFAETLVKLGIGLPDLRVDVPDNKIGYSLYWKQPELKEEIFSLLTNRCDLDTPHWINKDLILEALFFLLRHLDKDKDTLYEYRDERPGEATLLLYWLESILGLEEHGSSTPGWINHGCKFKWSKFKSAIKNFDEILFKGETK